MKTNSNKFDSLQILINAHTNSASNALHKLANDCTLHWEGRIVSFLARSKAYEKGDLQGLLEIATDLHNMHKTTIDFYSKYAGDLFVKDIAKKDKESKVLGIEYQEIDFLEKRVIPHLKHLLKED